MGKLQTINRLTKTRALAIVRTDSLTRGREIAQGCLDGKIDCLEISYTLSNAGEMIQGLKKIFVEQLIVGAGTVLDEATARLAVLSGAQFIIAPNFSKEVAKMCNQYQIPYAPGCASVTEAVEAMRYGATFIKAFPISDFYGPKLLKVFKTPIPSMPILISGGITLENLSTYLEYGADCLAFGSLLTKGTKEDITENAKRISRSIHSAVISF